MPLGRWLQWKAVLMDLVAQRRPRWSWRRPSAGTCPLAHIRVPFPEINMPVPVTVRVQSSSHRHEAQAVGLTKETLPQATSCPGPQASAPWLPALPFTPVWWPAKEGFSTPNPGSKRCVGTHWALARSRLSEGTLGSFHGSWCCHVQQDPGGGATLGLPRWLGSGRPALCCQPGIAGWGWSGRRIEPTQGRALLLPSPPLLWAGCPGTVAPVHSPPKWPLQWQLQAPG